MPWKAIQTLLSQVIYGGKIDSEFDQRLMVTFIEKLFTEKAFDADFLLVDAKGGDGEGGDVKVKMPDGIRRDQFLAWIEALSPKQSPVWLGLPDAAENVILTTQVGNITPITIN